jgi:glycine/serine hydroxymethyltransferase
MRYVEAWLAGAALTFAANGVLQKKFSSMQALSGAPANNAIYHALTTAKR